LLKIFVVAGNIACKKCGGSTCIRMSYFAGCTNKLTTTLFAVTFVYFTGN